MIASINPAALPALRTVGALFIVIYLLAGAWFFRNRHRFFDRDPQVAGDNDATRHVRLGVVLIPWLAVTTVLIVEWLGLWTN
jgi:hypothetical protein